MVCRSCDGSHERGASNMRGYVVNRTNHTDVLHLNGISAGSGTRGMNLVLINSVEDGANPLFACFTRWLDVSL